MSPKECLADIHCKKGFVCNLETKQCIVESQTKCPVGMKLIRINGKGVCRKVCQGGSEKMPINQGHPHSVDSCGENQYCKKNNVAGFYCETPRCDLKGQVISFVHLEMFGLKYSIILILNIALFFFNFRRIAILSSME